MRTLLEGGAFFESPRWHDGRWWLSDFYRHRVLTVTAECCGGHLDDMVVDSRGRAYAGKFGVDLMARSDAGRRA